MKEISIRNAEALGKQTLLFQTQEECGELIKAIAKYNRTRGIGQRTETTEETAYEDLIEEMADVEICLEQLIYLLNAKESVDQKKQIAFEKVVTRYGVKE